uniref:Ribosomal RNA small subunit methyltransferase A n=1 Tax=Heligmosomoides polygyrus TaxID=6339 RepID=A0A183F545_HELPZ
LIRPMAKRRMVIRVPFMQNPDSEQLSRIFHTSFTEQKRKKLHDDRLDELAESFY